MKFMQLSYFECVCRHENFSKAAKELYVSQPAVSNSVKELEDEFGVKLFNRQNNRLTLTEHGEFLFLRSKKILKDINDLVREMKGFGDSTSVIKIGTPPMIGTIFFPSMYTGFREKYNNIKIEIMEYGSLKARSMVIDNTADIAIAIMDKIIEKDLESLFLFETELVYCVSRNNHLSDRTVIDWDDLENEKIILMKEDSYQNELIKTSFAELNIEPNIVLSSSQLHTIKNFIHENVGGAFLFKELAENSPEICAIPLKNPIKLEIGLIFKSNSKSFREIKCFIEYMKTFRIQKYPAKSGI